MPTQAIIKRISITSLIVSLLFYYAFNFLSAFLFLSIIMYVTTAATAAHMNAVHHQEPIV